MQNLKLSVLCLLLVFRASEKSFVHTAPTTTTTTSIKDFPEVISETVDENIRELENLKLTIGKSFEMIKSQPAPYFNDYPDSHVDSTQKDTKIDTKRTLIDWGMNSDDGLRLNQKESNQFTPLQVAQYIFWTGDEKTITTSIKELLQAGIMTQEDAISYLEAIKLNLKNLQSHYSNKFGLETLHNQKTTKKQSQSQDINDDLMERLKTADFLYTEYSLEEIIYQLAKMMFTEGITRGNYEAQQALEKFTTFLESEANQGRISRTLEKKILDVLIASLTDTLSEHPEIHTIRAHSQDDDSQNALRQIMQMIPQETHRPLAFLGKIHN